MTRSRLSFPSLDHGPSILVLASNGKVYHPGSGDKLPGGRGLR